MKKSLLFSVITFILIGTSKAQNSFSFNCPKDTTIDCTQNCVTLTTKIPDVKAFTDDYGVNLTSGPGGCFRPPVSPSIPGVSTNLDRDDLYTPVIPMPFDFPFYGIIYAQLVVNTNGIISFDIDNAGQGAQWTITPDGSLPSTDYDRAIIMGAYHDIDIQFPNTSPTKQIKYDVIGTAPHRKWVLSFYKVPCFQNQCWSKINNTYQITLYEGLGLVDVHVWGREVCNTWNNGNAMIGMQNYDRNTGVMAPGREAWTTPRWGAANMNESWRFTPKVGPTLFKKVELTDLSGAVVATGDTASDGNNGLNVTFNNVCLNSTTQYVVKTQYYNFLYPFQFPVQDSIIYSTDTITVFKAGSVPPITLTTTQAQCGANPNGSITVTSPLGAGYEYSIDGGGEYQASPNFSVPPGTYTVTVHDVSGTCTRDTTVTISAPTTLSGSAVSTNTSCPEATNGIITVTGSLGTGAYTYAVDNISAPVFVASNVFSNQSSGDHTVFVKDAAGCIFSFTHTVNSDPVFTTTASSVNATCLGALNGSLTVTQPASGQAPFTYSIPGGPFAAYQSSPSFTGLAGDSTYTVNVKDNLGCVYVLTQPVGYDPGVTATYFAQNASCSGVDNGYIVLTPAGGTAPYFYQVDTGSAPSFVALDTIRNLGFGSFDVTIKDNIGCLYNIQDILVTSGSGVNATFVVRQSACATATTGSITINTGFTGTAPFQYSINGSAFQSFTGNNRSDTALNLAPGNYVIQVRDVVGCIFTSQPLTVLAGPDITASFVTVPTACAVATTGQIVVTPLTGTGPFSYSLDNAAFVALADTIRNLDSGFHSVTIRDANGCATTVTPEITLGTGVNATFTTVNSACTAASTGRIITAITSGIAPFTYSIDGGTSFNPLDTIRNLTEGTYNVLIRDGVGCEFTSPVTVSSNNPGVGATFATVNSACSGVSTGQIIITPTVGVAPFSYSTDAGVTYNPLDTIRNLAGNTYNIRVRDALGCAYDAPPVTVGNDAGVAATFTTTNSACAVASTGAIIPAVTSGTSPFEYSINAGTNYFPLDTIRNLSGGSYSVLIRDAVGCQFTAPVTVNSNNPGVGATFATVNSACSGVSTGKIIITPTIGVAPFSYSTDAGVTYNPLDTIRNLAGNTYNIRVRDALGCAYDAPPVTVGNDVGVVATFTTANSACAVASTGRIIPAVTSGTSPFEYSINAGTNYFPLDTIRNLSGGSYSVLIRDAVGCQFTAPVTVSSNNPGVGATFATVNSACSGVSTGQIIITPTVGVAPFSYSTDAGVTYNPLDTIRNLAGNTYNIRVRDALGCAYDAPPVTVGNNAGVAATFTTTNSACAVASTGNIIPAVTSGTSPFEYSINAGTNYFPLDTIRNLSGGSYSVLIRDAVGCQFTAPVTVNSNNPGVGATFATVNSACSGVSTGKIIITPTIGVAPFSYSTDAGVTYNPLDTIRNLAGNTYNIRVRDALGCAYDAPPVTVGNDVGVVATFTTANSACAVASTGRIIPAVTSGTSPFEYSINAGTNYFPLDTIRNLSGGSYSVLIRDAVGCQFTAPVTVSSNNPGVGATFATVNSACSGVSTGKIIITPTVGVAPFSYSTDAGVTYNSLDTIRNLASNTYNIRIKDALGCAYDAPPVTVNNNIGVTADFTLFKSACATAATGVILVKPLTGTRPFIYSIDAGGTYKPDSAFRNLAANGYTVRVRDAVGCIFDSPAQNITNEPGVLTNASTIQNSSCAAIPNGTITVNVTAGIPPLTYVVTSPAAGTPQSSNQFTSLFSGSYDITITDSAGCTKTITSVVGSNPKVQIDSLNVVRPTCNGLQNGTVTINVSLGVGPYQYAIDAGAFGSSKVFNSVGAGSHILRIKDANNCSIDSTIIITEPTLLNASIASTQKATCSGNPDGKIVAAASGGTPPYKFAIDAAGSTLVYQDSPSFDVLKGFYTITAIDAMGCIQTAGATVDSVFTMYLDLGPDTTLCSGSSITLNPGTNAETSVFAYSPNSALDNNNVKNPVASPTQPTTYTVTATWGICTLTDNVRINILRKPIPNAGNDVVICYDTTTTLRATASNLSGTVNYTWSPAALLETKADSTEVTVRPLDENTYFVVTVTDNYNCNFSVSDSVMVKMLPPVYAFAGNDTNAVLTKAHQLNATGAGVGGSYVWDYTGAGITLSDRTIANPTVIFEPVPGQGTYVNPSETNFYLLSVTATNAAGCKATDTIKVNVFVGPTVYVPSAFSPNGDGINDIFKPVNVGANIEYFKVFNRYGEVVFQTNRFRDGWNGFFKNKEQPVGAYVWVFKGKDAKGREVIEKGTVMLVR